MIYLFEMKDPTECDKEKTYPPQQTNKQKQKNGAKNKLSCSI